MKGTSTNPTDAQPSQDQGSNQVQAANENNPVVVNFPSPSDFIDSLQQQRLIAPRGLPRTDAAFYIGCSPRMFDGMVKSGSMPSPRLIGTKKVWDRDELDEFFEALPKADEDRNDWDEC